MRCCFSDVKNAQLDRSDVIEVGQERKTGDPGTTESGTNCQERRSPTSSIGDEDLLLLLLHWDGGSRWFPASAAASAATAATGVRTFGESERDGRDLGRGSQSNGTGGPRPT